MIMSYRCDGVQIADFQPRIAYRFAKNGLCFFVDRFEKVVGVGRINKAAPDAKLRQDVVELCERTTIQVVGRYKLIAGLHDIDQTVENRAGAGCHSQRANTALQLCNAFLKHIMRRIHQSGINIAQFL